MRNLKFDLTVETNALLCPNPQDFYSKSYITPSVVSDFRVIPGVKSATKIANATFTNVLQAAGCSWSAVSSGLDAVDVTVCPLEAMVEICQSTIEDSFVATQMVKGDANFEVASFMAYYWDELSKEIQAEIQDIRWNGDTSLTGTTYLKQCNGYLKQLDASSDVVKVTGATITAANIISALTTTVTSLPESVKGKKADVVIYMSAKNALFYQIATLGLNTGGNYTGELPAQFAGYRISVQEGMSDNYIVASNKNNLGYAFDGEGDSANLKAVNLNDSILESVIRTKARFKVGFPLFNETEIVRFKAS